MTQLIPEGKTRLLLLEGRDDKEFFIQLGKHLGFDDSTPIQIVEYGGKNGLAQRLYQLTKLESFGAVTRIGIVRDSDFGTDAFRSIQDAIQKHNKNAHINLPIPNTVIEPSSEKPIVSVLILPTASRDGMLEDVVMDVFDDDPVTICVDNYFDCIRKSGVAILEHKLSKARLRAFITGKNVSDSAKGDDSEKQYLSDTYKMTWLPDDFWNHPAFDAAKAFLKQLLAEPPQQTDILKS